MIEKKNTRQFFSLLLILISSISCNKNNVLQKSKKELLTQKKWKLIDNRQKLPNGSWSSLFPFMDSCRINDIYNYSPNFNYSVDEGISKCNANDSQTVVSGSWSFQNNETEILVLGTKLQTIILLTEDTLKHTVIMPVGWSSEIYEMTYIH